MTSFTQYTDAKIIENILSGEIAQYEIFIRRNNPFLYKVGRSYNYNHEDTQDLMQESFIDAYKNLSKFENRSSFKSWIIKIMLNHCFRKKQKFSFKNEIVAEIMDSSEPMFKRSENDTYKMVANRELHCIIEKALGSVPFDYRMVFSLREMNGLNVSETAKALEISEANVKVRLNRAKTMLRKEIEKSYSAEEIFEFNLIYCDAIVDHVMQTITEL
ncbi:MAG: sigma-70 family RNA polymerase sigma factor [Saprospiraceae bacterium]|jgi:RNA polymerase sigma factor (sigma-70 family)|uniref:sigma-70 family RNA polymerase sigma factor n=1 Tax=Candidatus Brachybacter algidus TaxID=2982024 RepID=UPI001B757C89|nr:sigma-70 family RNA polymerase sigma factor [Candidatus Brachybacter algidus]MBP7539192.1 sigma-70 family RNA polymerase sigma factor [Saprospiraceae bacterium]MBK6449080.1 sigma-70 family RNA polymerase sigma factor [Candidatus Brachybacter algidus]MBK7602047.1 sigma-70 family RNA polymerase sigma factor [Candidatus Brachybacter algidus]MBK8355685.1 sigma-70 family RNA polymerase sigma factor [Candidatus Brachybacter algidus]MBK8603243.1 sigma-70 family RNA polymerase sigma factor [Candida